MIKKLIIFLVRRRLKLRVGDFFIFSNQKTHSIYWFEKDRLMKMENGVIQHSTVSLNWLLNDDCIIHNFRHDNFGAVLAASDKEARYESSKIHSKRSDNN